MFSFKPYSLISTRLIKPYINYFSNKSKDSLLIIPGTKKLPPFTPGQRHARLADRSMLWKRGPLLELTVPLKKTGGRNNTGKICTRGRGGGAKRRYRLIDFKRNKFDEKATIERLEYDPNRSSYIALINYINSQERNYILAPNGIDIGDHVISSYNNEVELVPGNSMPIGKIPIGTKIHNVEMTPKRGGQLARSAGSFLIILEKGIKKDKYVKVEMVSKEKRLINSKCMATIGRVSNVNHNKIILGKAGRSRNLGRRPKVRGVAMNPCDHPHGGGNGKSKGHQSVSKWGKPTKGHRTRKKKHRTNRFIVERRPLNKKRYSLDQINFENSKDKSKLMKEIFIKKGINKVKKNKRKHK